MDYLLLHTEYLDGIVVMGIGDLAVASVAYERTRAEGRMTWIDLSPVSGGH